MAAEGARYEEYVVVNQLKELKLQCLEGLDPEVRGRVERLREIQSHHDELESKLFQTLTALEFKYQNLYNPLYSRRYDVLNITEESGGATVPEFWLLAMKNNNVLSKKITKRDQEALKLLKDIKWSRLFDEGNQPHSNRGFRLDFEFGTNPYFENSVLTKTYHLVYEPSDYNEPLVEKSIGTEIKWYFEKCLTQKTNKKNGDVEDCDSFFDFFEPPTIPVDAAELDEDGAFDLLNKMEEDYDLGCTIRDMIVPRAVSWFTGEAAVWGEDDEDREEDEDEDDWEEDENGNENKDKEDDDENENKDKEDEDGNEDKIKEDEDGNDNKDEDEDEDKDENEDDDVNESGSDDEDEDGEDEETTKKESIGTESNDSEEQKGELEINAINSEGN